MPRGDRIPNSPPPPRPEVREEELHKRGMDRLPLAHSNKLATETRKPGRSGSAVRSSSSVKNSVLRP